MPMITPLEPGAVHAPRAMGHQSVLPTAFGRITAAAASSRGSVHWVNEDAHSTLARPGKLFVVADGVGGGAMAALASRELVARLHAALDGQRIREEAVCAAVLAADRAIAESIAELTELPGAATLALCAPVNLFASKWLIAWVGDCRAYRIAANGAQEAAALTRDDTFEHLAENPPPGGAPDDPARMVGNGAVSRPNVVYTTLGHGELLLLCSDGVHKHVEASALSAPPAGGVPLAQHCEALIALARANGSTDDATVLLVQRSGLAVARPRWLGARGDGSGR
jgi:protein phosphatase